MCWCVEYCQSLSPTPDIILLGPTTKVKQFSNQMFLTRCMQVPTSCSNPSQRLDQLPFYLYCSTRDAENYSYPMKKLLHLISILDHILSMHSNINCRTHFHSVYFSFPFLLCQMVLEEGEGHVAFNRYVGTVLHHFHSTPIDQKDN